MASTPLIAKHAQAAQIEQHLLSTVGVTTQAVNDYIRKNFDPSKMLTVVVGTFK